MVPKAKVPLPAVATAFLDRVTTDPATDATVVPKAMPGPLTGIPTATPVATGALRVRSALPDIVALLAAPEALRAPVVWGVSTRMPLPTLVSPPAEPLMMPPKVVVTCGLSTVMVRAAPPRLTVPLSVRLVAAPPMVKLPPTTRLLASVGAEAGSSEVPAPIVRTPVPSGPEVTPVPAVLPVLLAPTISEPALSWTPPAKVLAPLSTSEPVPALMRPAGVAEFITFCTAPLRMSPTGEAPFTVMVLL